MPWNAIPEEMLRLVEANENLSKESEIVVLRSKMAYFDSYRSARLPASLTKAQRDNFGAHTYQRIDREGVFHTEWKEKKP